MAKLATSKKRTKRGHRPTTVGEGRERYTRSAMRIIPGAGSLGRRTRPFSPEAAVREFRSWAYAAVMLNANALASTPLRLYVRGGGRPLFRTRRVPEVRRKYLLGELGPAKPHRDTVAKIVDLGEGFQEVTEPHPALETIRTVNPWFNGFDLMQLLAIYMELTGNAYWHVVTGFLGTPAELWPMPSQHTWIVPDERTFIGGYVFGATAANQLRFEPSEVVHFRTANPGRDGLLYGMGKVEPAWSVIALNAAQHEMDLALADNHARPDYVAIIKGGGSGDQLDRFEKSVERKLRGTRQSGRMLSITGDVDLKPLAWPPKDMAGREDVVEEVAAIFGTPVSLLKANDPNLASARVGFASWRQNTVLPTTTLVEQKLNEGYLPLWGIEEDAVLAFDNPVPIDEEFQLKEDVQLVQGGIKSPNEVRESRGLEPKEGGDELGGQGSMGPTPDGGLAFLPFGSPAAGPLSRRRVPGRRVQLISAAALWAKQGPQEGLPGVPGSEGRAIPAFGSEVRTVLLRAINRVIESIQPDAELADIVQAILRSDVTRNAIAEAARPFVEAAIGAGGAVGAEKLPSGVGFDVRNPEVQRFVDRWTVRLADSTTGSFDVDLSELLGEGLKEGESVDQLRQRVQDWADVTDPERGIAHRAERIARTESARAYVEGERVAWQQSGVVAGKQWLLAPNPCEFCRALAAEFRGVVVPLDEPFYRLGHRLAGADTGKVMKLDYSDVTGPPLHPNCRCDLVPVLDEEAT